MEYVAEHEGGILAKYFALALFGGLRTGPNGELQKLALHKDRPKRETSDESKWSVLERPFFDKGGFGGKKLHRPTVRTLINLARENARLFFPQVIQYDKDGRLIYGLYGNLLNTSAPAGPPADIILCHRFRDRRLDQAIIERLAPGGLLAIAVLSEVGAAPGPFRAVPGELMAAFADLEATVAGEGEGRAWLLARARDSGFQAGADRP